MADKTWLAIVDGSVGYVLDVYPVERQRDLTYFGDLVIGEFADLGTAKTAVWAHMKALCDKRNLANWWP
jgi:hypothetical protein